MNSFTGIILPKHLQSKYNLRNSSGMKSLWILKVDDLISTMDENEIIAYADLNFSSLNEEGNFPLLE